LAAPKIWQILQYFGFMLAFPDSEVR